MELSINELADLTNRDRRTITRRLETLSHKPGPKGAYLYNTADALRLIYQVDSTQSEFDRARTEAALEQAAFTRVKREEAERKRPPLELVLHLFDQVFQATAATLKANTGKVLTAETVNEIFGSLRELPSLLKW